MLEAYAEYAAAARATMRPGATAHDVHRAVSAPFFDRGYPLGHVTGHSIGMTMIEHPRIGEGIDVELREGMVLSMHPHAIAAERDRLHVHAGHLVPSACDGGEPLSERCSLRSLRRQRAARRSVGRRRMAERRRDGSKRSRRDARGRRRPGHRTLADRAFVALHDSIVAGHLAPGERLPIEELGEALGMSAMPIREALRRLDAAGLVENIPHRGARVTELSIADLAEVYEARLALEPLAVSRAAERFDDARGGRCRERGWRR